MISYYDYVESNRISTISKHAICSKMHFISFAFAINGLKRHLLNSMFKMHHLQNALNARIAPSALHDSTYMYYCTFSKGLLGELNAIKIHHRPKSTRHTKMQKIYIKKKNL